ncbi:MAG: cysteine synthase A [Anaerotignaceae bacterium]
MAKIAENLIELIGNTPLVSLSGYCKKNGLKGNIIAKAEYFNPLGSTKDRAALFMINDAIERGLLKEDTVIIEPTSGNTGVGLAYIAAIRGYRLILTMPESMSIERRKLLKMLGAEIVLTPAAQAMSGAISKANELAKEYPNSFIPNQFENPANAMAHIVTTAEEIIVDTDGKIDYFVAGVGTGGTITGVGTRLKEFDKNIKIVAVEPFNSAVLSGESSGAHGLQGIGAGFIPKVLDVSIIDEVIKIKDEEALEAGREIAKTDGFLVGISSGAAIYAAKILARRPENEGKNIVVLLPDTGERYISTALFD